MRHPTNKHERKRIGDRKAKPAFETYYGATDMTPESHPGHFGTLRNTRKTCSNPMCCGNPRRTKGRTVLTIQEHKANAANGDE